MHLWATRIPLEACGAFVYNEQGELQDAGLSARLKTVVGDFIPYATMVKGLQKAKA